MALFVSVGKALANDLPLCPPSGYWHNCFGTYTADGDKYVGGFKDNKYHGQGTYTYKDGGKYVGEYKDGLEIQGTYTYKDGAIHVGEFKDGVPNGQGTHTYSSGNKYFGEFKDGFPNGQGTFIFSSGGKHVGEFKDGVANGQGTRTYKDGAKDAGEFKNGKLNGQGTYTSTDGGKYFGEFKDGEITGQGTFIYKDGGKDVGVFENGELNGYVVRYSSNGTIIKEGVWKNGEFQHDQEVTSPVPDETAPNEGDGIISASSGSGFAVSFDGYVITNHHVVDGCEKIFVHTQEKEFSVKVITYDLKNDLALLKGDFQPKSVFSLSKNSPELLQDVYVAGFPFGDKFSTSIKVTKGIVSSLTGMGNNFSNVQIDAALQSGNSGGPILDNFGNVIGVAVAKLDAKYMFEEFGIIPENTNFGIKSSVVRSVLESNNVAIPAANKRSISKSQLGEVITNGTYYISCWMTMAQIDEMRTKKVFFKNLD